MISDTSNEIREASDNELQTQKKETSRLKKMVLIGGITLTMGVVGAYSAYNTLENTINSKFEQQEQTLQNMQKNKLYIADPCFEQKKDYLTHVTPCYQQKTNE